MFCVSRHIAGQDCFLKFRRGKGRNRFGARARMQGAHTQARVNKCACRIVWRFYMDDFDVFVTKSCEKHRFIERGRSRSERMCEKFD